ncbi:hypothetical protein CPB84DRAFT_1964700 [Gymnopilus junonius]|uniref:ABM domain-containing protein n=1 Tax=Gymnopilus junonius TaxID=109634 RepID=A0A9P5TJP2_GYMJU|nr:hypothetical protein CPB84DRAFT_1964700 [Gymnopilus junonius]
MPLVEIAWWTPSEAYLADNSIIKPALDFLKTVEGCKHIYSGLSETDTDKTLFLFIVWETYDHHAALMAHPDYPQNVGLGPTAGSEVSVTHVAFTKDVDASLSAPVTEILAMTLQEGKTKEDFLKAGQAIAEQLDLANPKHAPVTWGRTLEDEKKFFTTVGWDSAEVHKEVITSAPLVPSRTELRNAVTFHMSRAKLVKYA